MLAVFSGNMVIKLELLGLTMNKHCHLTSKIIHDIQCLGKISIQVTFDKLQDSSDKFSHVFSETERVSQSLAFD